MKTRRAVIGCCDNQTMTRPLSTEEFDAFIDGLDYPLFVVTTTDGEKRGGCLVGFATQTSIDPPRLLICLSEANHTRRVAAGATVLAVHVMGSDDHAAAELFGGTTGDEVDKFARVRWHPGPDGVPLLDDLPRRMVGGILKPLPLGDHVGFLLEPIAEEVEEGETDILTLHDIDDVEPGHPA
ncbi:flavin reductase family protein [Microlunatus endophyticus]